MTAVTVPALAESIANVAALARPFTNAIRPVATLALTFDHRVIDGAYATRCVVRIKQLLEDLVP